MTISYPLLGFVSLALGIIFTLIVPPGRRARIIVSVHHRPRIRIDQHFRAVEAQPLLRRVPAMNTITIQLPGAQAGDENVPVVKRFVVFGVESDDSRRFGVGVMIEQQQFECGAVLGEDAEVHAAVVNGCAERVGLAGENIGHYLRRRRRDHE